MPIKILHSPPKMIATNSMSEHGPSRKNIHLQVAHEWQNKSQPAGGKMANAQTFPEQSKIDQSLIDNFIENLRTTTGKKEQFALLNRQISRLTSVDRDKFVRDVTLTLKGSQSSEDQDLLKEKFLPAYSMYFAVNMLNSQLNEEFRAAILKPPSFDGEEDNDDEVW